ncbi:CubicO group peptidase (beta-lactamase class C family) [Neolewinella xylanilytica]|uniref:CubicO group peptidase (Beta-lactamase class C family) n=1 Tax=Neolewinella xylanilytica TaxID=1514080 RepID=A0A2S6I859_9BACT|nr:serine hydrolase domain-containing protein [Neolewinella xylanilytica]PPK87672.1 CubicO group peptidase (beta-lactamase class C family) [Neolewinella xylanilytica]
MLPRVSLASLILLFSLGLTAQTATSQDSPPLTTADPATVGMSAERLARIDEMLTTAIEEDEVPGAVALVARRGKIVYHKAFGDASADGEELERDAIFRIASQTKAITSTAVMMLWEQGLFQLDDPIANYLPVFAETGVLDTLYEDGTFETRPVSTPITIRHLLTHTSGLGYGVIDGDPRFKRMYDEAGVTDLFTTEEITIEESVRKLATLPLHHDPGSKYTYSEGLDVLGYFIEVLSGMPLDEYFRTHIFEPLGMEDTWFYLPEDKYDRLVSIQRPTDDGWENYPTTFYDPDYPIKGARSFFSGGAGLSSTAEDYATFLQLYLNGGELNGVRLLSRTTVEAILSNQIGRLRGPGADYGLAFGLVNETGESLGGKSSAGTFEWGGYFNTQYFADPEEELIGILMKQTQATSKDQTAWKFRILVGAAIAD